MSANLPAVDVHSSASCSSPEPGSESRGSSVSAGLREEYEDILKYAVVAPKLLGESSSLLQSLPPPAPTSLLEKSKPQEEEDEEQESSSHSLPSELPSPPHPTSPPPHPSLILHHLSQSPSPPSPPSQFITMTQEPSSHYGHPPLTTLPHDPPAGGGEGEGDPEVARLAGKLDQWCLDLKRNVLAEFEQARIRVLENKQREMEGQLQQHAYAMHQVQEELERYKELVATFETSIARKDQLIASLNTSLEKQKSRVQLQKSFSTWKIQHHDDQREAFTSALARRHYHSQLKAKMWEAWFGIIRERWRQRVERACQTKAEEVCVQLSTDYDERLAVSQRALDEARQEILQLKAQQSLYEQNMKQAFMRGVCALNMEAMTMFRGGGNGLTPGNQEEDESDVGQEPDIAGSDNHPPHLPPSLSAPLSHLHGNQMNIPQGRFAQPPPSSQHPPFPPSHSLPTPPPPPSAVATSTVQVQTSQPKLKNLSSGGRSSVGVASRRKGCGRTRPAVMVERHTLG